MKSFVQVILLASLISFLPSCKGHNANGPQPIGTLYVNGVSVNGSVEIGNVRIYTLQGITAGNKYLVRTAINPGGDLFVDIYSSLAAYKGGEAAVKSATALSNSLYEASFTASQSGDYVAVLHGTPATLDLSSLYFYALRIMSATGPALSSFGTVTVDLSSSATATGTILSDSIVVFSGETITPAGTYSILLTTSTVTLSYPQMFIYEDNSLSSMKLLYSAISASDPNTATQEFLISTFTSTPTFTVLSSTFSTTCTITNVPFTSGTASGPFIMMKGISQATYTLQVGP